MRTGLGLSWQMEPRCSTPSAGLGFRILGMATRTFSKGVETQMDKHLHTMVYGEFLQDVQVQASSALRETLPFRRSTRSISSILGLKPSMLH